MSQANDLLFVMLGVSTRLPGVWHSPCGFDWLSGVVANYRCDFGVGAEDTQC